MVDQTDDVKHVGQQFGNYRSLVLLGTSHNASIYLGEHVHLKTQAAIRLYRLRLLDSDQQNFLHEARIIARLVHPHIVRVLEFGMERDMPYLITAYPAGGMLRQHHAIGTSLSLPTILSYLKPIAAALDYAHKQQVLHLDIKPENIWLGRNNTIMVDNFRITLFSHSSRSESIQEAVDTVAYIAPEQIQGRACPASDQYALGVMVYEWLSGSRPFLRNDYVEIARQHLHAVPPRLVERVPGLSLAIEHVVMRALAKDAAQRFSTVQAFVDALEQSFLSPNTSTENTAVPSHYYEHPTSPLLAPILSSDAAYAQASTLSLSTLATPLETPHHTRSLFSRRKVAAGLLAFTGAVSIGAGLTWFSRSSPSTNSPHPVKPAPPGTTFHIYRGHADDVYATAWSRDGRRIASWSWDGTMQIWDATTFAPEGTHLMANVLSWSPDWRYMVSGSADGFQAWEMATGRVVITHSSVRGDGGGRGDLPANSSVQWSPDGKYVAATFNSTQVWDIATGKTLFSYDASGIAWSPDGKRIALSTSDYSPTNAPSSVQILDVGTENQIKHYNIQSNRDYRGYGYDCLVWSPNGKYLASSMGQIWDAASGMLVSTLKGSSLKLVWSPNSKYLASCDNSQATSYYLFYQEELKPKVDATVHIWNALTGKDIFVYDGHTAGVNYVVWSPDGTKIASASADMTVRVWQAI